MTASRTLLALALFAASPAAAQEAAVEEAQAQPEAEVAEAIGEALEGEVDATDTIEEAGDETAAETGLAPADEAAGAALAEAFQKGYLACARHLVERGYLAVENKTKLDEAGIDLGIIPPEEVMTVASMQFGESPVFGKIASEAGEVWLIASPSLGICKVTAANTLATPEARRAIDRRFRDSVGWVPDEGRWLSKDGVSRQGYVLNPDKPGSHLVMLLDGPDKPGNGGDGIQAIMTVFIDTPKAG